MQNLNEQIEQARHQARVLIDGFGPILDGIRNDRTLSDEGKNDRIATEYVARLAAVESWQARESDAVLARRTELERKLLGWEPTTDVATIRARRESTELADALDDPRDALTAYEEAKLRSDALHVQAIFARALRAGWLAIVNDYVSEHPIALAAAQELDQIRQLLDPNAQVIVASVYYLPKPRELASVYLDEYRRRAAS
ncbi:hypothetical protein [Agromyces sp. NPDC055661]